MQVPVYCTGMTYRQLQDSVGGGGGSSFHPEGSVKNGSPSSAVQAPSKGGNSGGGRGGAPAGLIDGHVVASSDTTVIPFTNFMCLKQSIAEGGKGNPSSHQPNWKNQLERNEERKKLHEKSVEMVNKWNNTIAGQRKARLAAQQEKARVAEEQRQQIDRDWAIVKANDRQEMIERAQNMQYLKDARVRQLNSQALVTQVLKERKAQIEIKKAQEGYERELSQEEKSQLLSRLAVADQKEAHMKALAIQKRYEIAAANRALCESRQATKRQEKADQLSWCVSQNEAAVTQVHAADDAIRARRNVNAKEVATFLDQMVQEHRDREAKHKEESKEQDRINRDINAKKMEIACKRKEIENVMISGRVARNEYVAQLQVPQEQAQREVRNAFLTKLEHAHEGEFKIRLNEEAQKRNERVQACVSELHHQVAAKKLVAVQERVEAAQVRVHNEQVARGALLSAELRRDRKKNTQRDFGDLYRKEMLEHTVKANERKAASQQEAEALVDQAHQEDRAFHRYAERLVDTLQHLGNDPSLVQKRLVEMDLDPRSRNHFTEKEVNTFDRLGFNGK